LDGWGINPRKEANAIALAKTPNMDELCRRYPCTEIASAGEAVGLPNAQMGNSEVGHLNIGAGRIVYQEYTRINKAIADGTFFANPALLGAVRNVQTKGSSLHLMGLLSDGGVHSHNTHLYALLELARREKVERIYVHLFLDGRDVPPQSAISYITELEEKIKEIRVGEIATISGRYYAMDRDRRWDRTKLAYEAIVYGRGERASTPEEAVKQSYAQGVVDEFVRPTILIPHPSSLISDGDSIILFNFRPDRARQLTRAFIQEDFAEFDRGEYPPKTHFVTMTQYDAKFNVPVAFLPSKIKNTLAHVLATHGLKQLHIAETEKYAHVTFFFNGGVEKPEEGEERVLIPSPKVPTYDLKPEMSAYEVTDRVIEEIKKGLFDVVVLNYANPDMVGHTAILPAVIKAIEAVDTCVGRVIQAVQEVGGDAIITADHGNAEKLRNYETGRPHTAHTNSPVPLILVSNERVRLRQDGILADIAPTILDLLGLPKPPEMTGQSLILGRR
jgi:2,3-bisphosphoglycerate-independent phosphoglycerate mutase